MKKTIIYLLIILPLLTNAQKKLDGINHNISVINYLTIESDDLDTDDLMNKAKIFFKKNGLLLNWREFEKLDKAQRINTLSMISPVTNEEKQKLLEAITITDKVNTLKSIISFYLHEVNFSNQTVQ